jgi:hypothetical protein
MDAATNINFKAIQPLVIGCHFADFEKSRPSFCHGLRTLIAKLTEPAATHCEPDGRRLLWNTVPWPGAVGALLLLANDG